MFLSHLIAFRDCLDSPLSAIVSSRPDFGPFPSLRVLLLSSLCFSVLPAVTVASSPANVTIDIGVFLYANDSLPFQLPNNYLPTDPTQLDIVYGLKIWYQSVVDNGGIPLQYNSTTNYVMPNIRYFSIGNDNAGITRALTYYETQFYYYPQRGIFENIVVIVPPADTLATPFMQMCESTKVCIVHSPLTNSVSQAICQAADVINPTISECFGKLVGDRRFEYSWQYLPNYEFTMQSFLEWLKSVAETIDITTISFYYPNDPFGVQIYQPTLDVAQQNKFEILEVVLYNNTINSSSTHEQITSASEYFTEALENTRGLSPDVLLIGGDLDSNNDCSRIINILEQMDYMPKIVGFGGGCLQQVINDPTISEYNLAKYLFGVLPWDESVQGFDYHTVIYPGNWEQFPSTSTEDAPKIFANYVREYFNIITPGVPVLEASIVLMGIGALTGIGIQKAIENANTLDLTATALNTAMKSLYLPSFYGRLSFDLQGRIVMEPELVIQMGDETNYELITPYSVGVPPIIPIPTWDQRKSDNTALSSIQEQIVTAIAVTVILAMFVITCFIWYFQETKLIRGSTPLFCCLILLGGMIFVSSVWMWPYHGATPGGCQTFVWLLHLGFTLMIQSMVIKTFRLWRIFIRQQLSVIKITIYDILVGLMIVMTIDIVYLGVWSIVSPITTQEVIVDPDRIVLNYTTCSSGTDTPIFEIISIVYHGFAMGFMIYISWSVRNIAENFNETVYIAVGFYVGSFIISLVLGVLLSGVTDNMSGYLIRSFGIILITVFTIAPLFWSKVYGVMKELYSTNSRVTRVYGPDGDGSKGNAVPGNPGELPGQNNIFSRNPGNVSVNHDSNNRIKIMANSLTIDVKKTVIINREQHLGTPRKTDK